MNKQNKLEILVNENLCTGCRICQLICSFNTYGIFSVEKAFIKIENAYKLVPKISFLDGCTKCGLCVQDCLYGALKKVGDKN
ncbi:MAG: 4Fe-4S dicluster domain-containing protein [Promethearchaeota archaeon]